MLALPCGDNEIPTIYSNCSVISRIIEPAGIGFENYLKKRLERGMINDILDSKQSDSDDDILEDEEEPEWEKEYYEKLKSQKEGMLRTAKGNYYSILGLDKLFLSATENDIRKAYKGLVVKYHPDKIKNDEDYENNEYKEEIKAKWLSIQDAYDTLTDPEKKKKYDSTFEFDDTVPSFEEELSPNEFFHLYGPCFLKNAIWSKRKPVPKLGDMNTKIEKVKKFYKFWLSFESWREFSVDGEYNLEEASNRWEKRQMMKENKKMKSSYVKEEKVRLCSLVMQAYKSDPRIRYEEEKAKEQREIEKQERLKKRDQEKREIEERKIQIQKEKEEENQRQQEFSKKEKEEFQDVLYNIAAALEVKLTDHDRFQIKLNSTNEKLKNVIQEVSKATDKTNEEKAKIFKKLSNLNFALNFSVGDITSTIWTKEDINFLQKAIKKYPAGTKDRWNKVAEIVKNKSNEQIVKLTHYLSANPSLKISKDQIDLKDLFARQKVAAEPKPDTTKNIEDPQNWTENQQKSLESALKTYPTSLPVNERWTKICSEVQGKTKKQCVERYKYLSSLVKK